MFTAATSDNQFANDINNALCTCIVALTEAGLKAGWNTRSWLRRQGCEIFSAENLGQPVSYGWGLLPEPTEHPPSEPVPAPEPEPDPWDAPMDVAAYWGTQLAQMRAVVERNAVKVAAASQVKLLPPARLNVAALTYRQLQAELKALGKSASGKKPALQARLTEAIAA